MRTRTMAALVVLLAGLPPAAAQEDPASRRGEARRRGGRLVASLTSEPQTFNPLTAADVPSLAVAQATMSDLVHLDRESQTPEAALARSWKVSDDGRRYALELRRGLRFSDGEPFDADDVVFTFLAHLDERIGSPQRPLLTIGGRPVSVRKTGDYTVEIEIPEPNAAAERMFDNLMILPQHLLSQAQARGELAGVWDLGTPPERIAGLGPFRLLEFRPGERLILERNPHYWKRDAAGTRLPYLDQLVFLFVPSQDAQVVRFQAGDLDVVERLSAESYALLEKDAQARGLRLLDLGPGLDYNFLFFNLNDLGDGSTELTRRQTWFRQRCFRQAVSAAVDRQGIVRLVFGGRAAPLATHVTPGNKRWVNRGLGPTARSLAKANGLLAGCGFRRDGEGALLDPGGRPVELSILTVASSSQRRRIATVVQQDLAELGMTVRVAALEMGAVLERIFQTHDYDAAILGLSGGDGDPNAATSLLLSTGSLHLWRLGGSRPAAPWQAEIDRLMGLQLSARDPHERKRLYDRVQEIMAEEVPVVSLVSPNVLVGAKARLGNFRPAVLDPQVLWNVEELYWE